MKVVQHLGNSNLLAEVGVLVEKWDITRNAAFRLLRAVKVPLLHIAGRAYFNMYALEKVIYYLSKHGSSGFAAPGSDYKNKDRHKNESLGNVKVEITDKDLEAMDDPIFIAEWQVTANGSKPATVSNLTQLLSSRKKNKK